MASGFKIIFWGTRGSMPVVRSNFRRYGGNTSCVQMLCGDYSLIFDAGTGISQIPFPKNRDHVMDVFFSHTHLDHIQGLPFFKALYRKGLTIRLWAGHLGKEKLDDVLGTLFQPSIFPLSLKEMSAKLMFKHFKAGAKLAPAKGVTIRTLAIAHPGKATAYRVEYQGKSVCYVTDVEHQAGQLDKALLKFIHKADVFIYDASYDDKEMKKYRGWGHSSWQHGARLAEAASVRKFVAFHHAAEANDAKLNQRSRALKKWLPNSVLARDGLKINLS